MGDHLSVHVKILDLGIIGISMVIEILGLKRENLRRIYKMREVSPRNNIYGIEGGKGIRESIPGDRRK